MLFSNDKQFKHNKVKKVQSTEGLKTILAGPPKLTELGMVYINITFAFTKKSESGSGLEFRTPYLSEKLAALRRSRVS